MIPAAQKRLVQMLADISIRCPQCKGVALTSDNRGNHRCLHCGHRCTDRTAYPSAMRVRTVGLKAALAERNNRADTI